MTNFTTQLIRTLLTWASLISQCTADPFYCVSSNSEVSSSVDCVDISNDGKIFVTGSADDRAYVYNTSKEGTSNPQILTESVGNVRDVDLTEDGEWLVIAD